MLDLVYNSLFLFMGSVVNQLQRKNIIFFNDLKNFLSQTYGLNTIFAFELTVYRVLTYGIWCSTLR